MSDKQSHVPQGSLVDLVEVWFDIEKDASGYPESKSWEGLFAEKTSRGFVVKSVPFYLKNVSVGDTVEAKDNDFLCFSSVVSRGGHNTYRLLLSEEEQPNINQIVHALQDLGLRVETEIGMLLAIDVPQSADQQKIDALLIRGEDEGRWQLQDGCLKRFR